MRMLWVPKSTKIARRAPLLVGTCAAASSRCGMHRPKLPAPEVTLTPAPFLEALGGCADSGSAPGCWRSEQWRCGSWSAEDELSALTVQPAASGHQ